MTRISRASALAVCAWVCSACGKLGSGAEGGSGSQPNEGAKAIDGENTGGTNTGGTNTGGTNTGGVARDSIASAGAMDGGVGGHAGDAAGAGAAGLVASAGTAGGLLGLGGGGACFTPASDGPCLATYQEMSQVACSSISFRNGPCGSYLVWYCPDFPEARCLYDQNGALRHWRYCDNSPCACNCQGGSLVVSDDGSCEATTLPPAKQLPEAVGIGPDGSCYTPPSTGPCTERFADTPMDCANFAFFRGPRGSELVYYCPTYHPTMPDRLNVECYYTQAGDLRQWRYSYGEGWTEPCTVRGGVRTLPRELPDAGSCNQ